MNNVTNITNHRRRAKKTTTTQIDPPEGYEPGDEFMVLVADTWPQLGTLRGDYLLCYVTPTVRRDDLVALEIGDDCPLTGLFGADERNYFINNVPYSRARAKILGRITEARRDGKPIKLKIELRPLRPKATIYQFKTPCPCGNEVSTVAKEISEARGRKPTCEDCLGVSITPKAYTPPAPRKCASCPDTIGDGGTRNHCAKCRERINQYCHTRRKRLRAAHLCIFCGHHPALFPTSPLCLDCRTRQSAQAKARYKPTGRPRGRRRKVGHFTEAH